MYVTLVRHGSETRIFECWAQSAGDESQIACGKGPESKAETIGDAADPGSHTAIATGGEDAPVNPKEANVLVCPIVEGPPEDVERPSEAPQEGGPTN